MTAGKFGSGAEALQVLVDTRARLKAIHAWQAELADWQRGLNTEESRLVQRQRDALDYITILAQEDPTSLGLSVSEDAAKRIEIGEHMMSESFERTQELVA